VEEVVGFGDREEVLFVHLQHAYPNLPYEVAMREIRVLDGPASVEKGSKGKNKRVLAECAMPCHLQYYALSCAVIPRRARI